MALGLAAVALAACSTVAPKPSLEEVISGRLSLQIQAPGDGTPKGFTGQFELRGSETSGALEISGPLGAVLAKVSWSPGRYRWGEGDGARDFSSMEELTRTALGESLPLAALFNWLRAKAWSGAPFAPRTDGQPGFEQLGWSIETRDMATGRVRATRQLPTAVSLRVQLDPPF